LPERERKREREEKRREREEREKRERERREERGERASAQTQLCTNCLPHHKCRLKREDSMHGTHIQFLEQYMYVFV